MSFRTLSFGDLESGVWGSVWSLDDGGHGFSLVGDPSQALPLDLPAAIEASDETGTWQLSAQGLELRSIPHSEPAAVPDGLDQLTRVQGRVEGLGAEHELDCLGRRGTRERLALQEFESVRDVAAWFAPDQGLAVLAARPRGASSHAEDVVSASAFEEGHAVPVADPRVSTTYLADGLPARASFELWPELPAEDESQEESEQDRPEARPRRAAGEAVGPRAGYHATGLDVHAALFRWHSRGRQGAGVYVLARSR